MADGQGCLKFYSLEIISTCVWVLDWFHCFWKLSGSVCSIAICKCGNQDQLLIALGFNVRYQLGVFQQPSILGVQQFL